MRLNGVSAFGVICLVGRTACFGASLPAVPQSTRAGGGLVTFTVVNRHWAPVATLHTTGCSNDHTCFQPALKPLDDPEDDHTIEFQSNRKTQDANEDQNYGDDDNNQNDNDTFVYYPASHKPFGYIGVNRVARFAVPMGYTGKLSVNDARFPQTGQAETLIEAAYGYQGHEIKLALDVSMVQVILVKVEHSGHCTLTVSRDGFTLPVTCSCGGTVVTGCSWDLFEEGDCPVSDAGPGFCRNPLRGDAAGVTGNATAFFRPCQAAAYTFPADHKANFNNDSACMWGVHCCVGTACPPQRRQCHGSMVTKDRCREFLA